MKDIHIPSVLVTSTHTFSSDFVSPALAQSIGYDRGVGYFTSGWIKNNIKGIIPFIENGGIARMLTSPILLESDVEALTKGAEAMENPALHEILKEQVKDLTETLTKDTLLLLAWLVADRRLIFRIAIPTEKLRGGDFHDKIGIFIDDKGNKVSFSGGYNETAKGEINYDSIKTFKSWEPALKSFVDADHSRFEQVWDSKDPNLMIYSLPTSIKNKIIELTALDERPYRLTPIVYAHGDGEKSSIQLRPYQAAAIEEWLSNGYKGTMRMATGTGKTITAVFCIKQFFSKEPFGIPVVLCPYLHLVTQWQDEISKLGYESLLCKDSTAKWSRQLNTMIEEKSLSKRLGIAPKEFVVICTNKAFFSATFRGIVESIRFPIMLTADEVHNIGTKARIRTLPQKAQYRLGLSATPERFMDEEGTQGIFDYFGEVIYSLDLKDAIFKLKALSRYDYQLNTVHLSESEFERYKEISAKIARLLIDDEDAMATERFNQLLRERANILNNATAKLGKLREILKGFKKIDKLLIYTSPSQLVDVNRILVNEFDVVSHQVTYREAGESRDEILNNFRDGIYQAITAIRCLDEGLDVPATNTAIILASSSNPKEFIQRRGRVLRKSEGKGKAHIIDVMAIPPSFSISAFSSESEYNAEKAILKKELSRIQHFASCAENKNEILLSVYDLASKYGLQHILGGET